MKHSLQVTILLVALFLFIQFFGLYTLSENTVVAQTPEGDIVVEHEDTVVGKRPQMEGLASLLYVLFGVLIGTGLMLLFVRFGKFNLWRGMYFLAIWLSCSVTLGVYVPALLALGIAIALALFELKRTNVILHNATELLIYPGIAVLFVPLFSIPWMAILLLIISAYDVFAVFKSKHMVSLAKFQAKSKAFAGFIIPYGGSGNITTKKIPGKLKEGDMKVAVLGGGDIAFPLLFSGVVLDALIMTGMGKFAALLNSLIVPVAVAVMLGLLFVMAEKDKFYPAMPFVSIGCFAGFFVVALLNPLLFI